MADPEDNRLAGEFAAYREALLPEVQLAGPTAVRETVRNRHRRSTAATAAVALLTVAVPVASWAAVGARRAAQPTPAATGAPSPTRTGSPTATVPPTSATRPQPAITRADLLAATVDLPDWPAGVPCASGPTRLIEPKGRPGDNILSGIVGGYGDVDGDGVAEPVALVRCLVEEGSYPEQVVAFDRDAGGRVVVLGRVFRSDSEKPEWLFSLSVRPDGMVRVEVTDVVRTDGRIPDESHRQWRGYRWNGSDFVQTEGPLSFGATSPVAPAATIRPASSGRPAFDILGTNIVYDLPDRSGARRGSTTLTFRNITGKTVEYPLITYLDNGADLLAESTAQGCWNFFRTGDRITCLVEPVKAGEQGEVELPFTTRSNGPGHQLTLIVEAGEGDAGPAVPDTGATLEVDVAFGG